VCGDYNVSGALTSADIFLAYNIISEYDFPSLPVEAWGGDGHDEYTIRDVVMFAHHVFGEAPAPDCSTSAEALFPAPGIDFVLAYTREIPADSDSARVFFDLICHRRLAGLHLGFRMLIDGQPPASVLVSPFTGASGRTCLQYYLPPDSSAVEPGICLFGYTAFGGAMAVGRKTVAVADIEVVPAAFPRTVTIDIVDFDTLLPDSLARHFTAVVDDAFDMWTLQSVDDICPVRMTGDGDMSGALTSSDIITLVNYVFQGGSFPLPCAASGDVNCDVAVNSSDIILLVNHIFKGDVPPCDACTVWSDPWGCF
jgi:hypothetical protein